MSFINYLRTSEMISTDLGQVGVILLCKSTSSFVTRDSNNLNTKRWFHIPLLTLALTGGYLILIASSIVGIAESVFKGTVNLIGGIFSKELSPLRGLQQITVGALDHAAMAIGLMTLSPFKIKRAVN